MNAKFLVFVICYPRSSRMVLGLSSCLRDQGSGPAREFGVLFFWYAQRRYPNLAMKQFQC